MTKHQKRQAFLFGKLTKPINQFNNPGTDRHFQAWIADDEFVGRDRFSVERDAQVAVGFHLLKGARADD